MALPAGWIDTGILVSHSGSFMIDVAGVAPAGAIAPGECVRIADTWIGLDVAGAGVACDPFGSRDTVSLYVRQNSEAYAARTTVDSDTGSCPQPRLTTTVVVILTNLRLGATLAYTTASDTYSLAYALFADGGTTHTVQVGGGSGRTTTYSYASATQITAGVDVKVYALYAPGLGAGAPWALADGVKVTGETWNGETNPNGDRSVTLYAADIGFGYGSQTATISVYPPLKYTADVRIEDCAGATPAGNVRVGAIAYGETSDIANAGSSAVSRWGWASATLNAQLVAPWTINGITTDLSPVPLRRIRPKRPNSAPEHWSPVTYQITSPLSVLQSANNFSGAGSVALSGAGNRTWTVTGAATVSRLLAGTYDPSDSYTTTKRAAGEDVWGWSLYSYLDIDITADVAATLTLTVYYVTDNALGTTTTRTYTFSTINGTVTRRIDLLWPASGGPDYWERVSRLDVSGLSNGTYTLNSLALVAAEQAYVKLHARRSGASDVWSGLVIAQDGSFPAYQWGENPVLSGTQRKKDHESGYDGATSGYGGCVKMNSTIQAVATEWNRMEGITTTYSSAGPDADFTDGVNTLGFVDSAPAALTYTARWLHTVMGERAAANVAKTLYASLLADLVTIPPAPAGTFILPFRLTIGALLEGLCVTGAGARAGQDFPMNARRSATGTPDAADPVIGSGLTDASGFVSVPIPTGLVGSSAFYTYLSAG